MKLFVVSAALLVRPGVRPHLRFDDELITLTRGTRDRLPERTERDELDGGDDLPRPPSSSLPK